MHDTSIRLSREQVVACSGLAELVRQYLTRPTTGNREAMQRALAIYDERMASDA